MKERIVCIWVEGRSKGRERANQRGVGKPHNKGTGVFSLGKRRGRYVGCESARAPGRHHMTPERQLADDCGSPGRSKGVTTQGGSHIFPSIPPTLLLDVPSCRRRHPSPPRITPASITIPPLRETYKINSILCFFCLVLPNPSLPFLPPKCRFNRHLSKSLSIRPNSHAFCIVSNHSVSFRVHGQHTIPQ